MSVVERNTAGLFFIALQCNAVFSLICGVDMTLMPSTIAAWLGADIQSYIRGIGIGLVVFGLWLLFLGKQGKVKLIDAWSIILGDLAWVLGSAVIILFYPGSFSASGLVLISVIACIVGGFGLAQAYGLLSRHKLKQA